MTVEEFNTKYKAYLEEGHYGLVINIQMVIDYLDNLFETKIISTFSGLYGPSSPRRAMQY